MSRGFPGGSAGKESVCHVEDLGSISGLGRSLGEGNGYPPQNSGLENSMDCIVHAVAKSQTWQATFTYEQILGAPVFQIVDILGKMSMLWVFAQSLS